MPDIKYPKSLKKDPIAEVIFEVRLESAIPVSIMLPGQLQGAGLTAKSVNKLPLSEIPEMIRKSDPALKHRPTVVMELTGFDIYMGDDVFLIATNNYPGWTLFKEKVCEILRIVSNLKLIDNVVRYALKYTNILESDIGTSYIDLVNVKISVGDFVLKGEPINLATQISEVDVHSIITLNSHANIKHNRRNISRDGVLIDIDSSVDSRRMTISNPIFSDDVVSLLDKMHSINKKLFFSILTENAINKMEPSYE